METSSVYNLDKNLVVGKNMPSNYITEKDLKQLEEKIDMKITIAIQPLEGKIDNLSVQINSLPIQLENMLLKERQ